MAEQNLKDKTVNGLSWNMLGQMAAKGITFVFSVFLARILLPEDYGVVAMLSIFLAICQTFIDSGFAGALIRKVDRTEQDKTTVLIFNVVVSVFCYLVLFFCAPLIARFYHQPLLVPVTRVSCLSLVIGSFAGVHSAILSIRIDFKSGTKANIAACIVSGAVGIVCAARGMGVWALVVQSLVQTTVNTVLIIYYAHWRAKLRFSIKSFLELFSYGSKMLASALLNTIYNNLSTLVIGRFFAPSQLGAYSKAKTFSNLPSSVLTGAIEAVSFPVLSSIQNEEERLVQYYKKFIRLSTFVIFPLMIGLAAVADPLVRLLLTDKWEAMIPLLQICCLSLIFYPVHSINLNILKVKGRSDLFLKLEIIKKIIGVTILVVTVRFGVKAICWGGVISSCICLPLNSHYTKNMIGYGTCSQMKDLLPFLLLSAVMYAVIAVEFIFIKAIWIRLLIGIVSGVVSYLGLALLLRLEEPRVLYDILIEKVRKR